MKLKEVIDPKVLNEIVNVIRTTYQEITLIDSVNSRTAVQIMINNIDYLNSLVDQISDKEE